MGSTSAQSGVARASDPALARVARLTSAIPGGRPLKRRLRNSPTACGVTYVASTAGRDDGFTILTHHRVFEQPDPFYGYGTPVRDFERQLKLLRRFCAVLSLDEILDRLDRSARLPRRCVALTVDDGYRDLAIHGAPRLARYGLPATLFVAVDALTRGWLWPDLLRHAIRATSKPSVSLEALADGGRKTFALGREADQLATVDELDVRLKRMENGAKWAVLDEVAWKLLGRRAHEITIPGLMMNWDELRALPARTIAVGAHTVSHPILSRVSEQEAAKEITESRRRLEDETGRPVAHFAYPNGRAEDISPAVRRLVRWAGFRSACTTIPRYNRPGIDRWSLGRLDANHDSLRDLIRFMAEAP
jgi:peptidoglycan/xylan/chitin deacetylase (PgdA/CDA1 family)